MPKPKYERLNSYVMGVIYSPLLLLTAWLETWQAYRVIAARRRGDADDDEVEEWEQMGVEGQCPDFESDGWAKTVESTKPNVETDAAVLEIRDLKEKLEKLTAMVEEMKRTSDGA